MCREAGGWLEVSQILHVPWVKGSSLLNIPKYYRDCFLGSHICKNAMQKFFILIKMNLINLKKLVSFFFLSEKRSKHKDLSLDQSLTFSQVHSC